MSGTNAALDHAPFTIDEFKLGKAQEEADMIETLAGGFGGELFILAQEGRQFELSQVMREQCGGAGLAQEPMPSCRPPGNENRIIGVRCPLDVAAGK